MNQLRALRLSAAVLVVAQLAGCLANRSGPLSVANRLEKAVGAQRAARPAGRPSLGDELPVSEAAAACLATAEELQQHGHRREAILLLERARQLVPKSPGVARRLAVLYQQQQDSTKALAEFQKALKEAPRDPDLLNDVGFYHLEQCQHAEAEKLFRDALRHEPSHERASVNLGLTLAWQGRYEESIEAFSPAVGKAAAWSNVGVVQTQQGKYDEAKRSFEQALALQADLKPARAFLAYLHGPAESR